MPRGNHRHAKSRSTSAMVVLLDRIAERSMHIRYAYLSKPVRLLALLLTSSILLNAIVLRESKRYHRPFSSVSHHRSTKHLIYAIPTHRPSVPVATRLPLYSREGEKFVYILRGTSVSEREIQWEIFGSTTVTFRSNIFHSHPATETFDTPSFVPTCIHICMYLRNTTGGRYNGYRASSFNTRAFHTVSYDRVESIRDFRWTYRRMLDLQ